MSGNLRLNGATSGYSELAAPDVAGDQTFTFPATGGTLAIASNNTAGVPVPGYQQGTWAPTLTLGSATVYENRWTRIGNQVTVYCALGSFTDTTSNAAIAVEGMPYQVTGRAVGSAIVNKAVTSNNVQVDHVYIESETNLQFINSGANDTDNWRNLLHSGMGSNNCDIWFTITYLTNNTTWAPTGTGATVS